MTYKLLIMDGLFGRSGSGDRGGSHPCCLDSLVVSKSGQNQATCVFGDSTDAGQHGIQVTDYLLGKLLKSERYDRVVVMWLDRRVDVVYAAARQYLEKECEGQTNGIMVERCLTKLSLHALSQFGANGCSSYMNDMCAVVTTEVNGLFNNNLATTMTPVAPTADRNRPIAGYRPHTYSLLTLSNILTLALTPSFFPSYSCCVDKFSEDFTNPSFIITPCNHTLFILVEA